MYELLIRCGKLVVLLGLSLSIPVKLSYFITKCDIVIILEDMYGSLISQPLLYIQKESGYIDLFVE